MWRGGFATVLGCRDSERDGRIFVLRRQVGRLAVCSIAVVLAAAGAASAATPRQVGSLTFTSTTPGTSTGFTISLQFQNPDSATEKPYAAMTMVIHGPPGSVIDTSVPPQCDALDAQLLIEGPSACPADSQIGGGTAVSDSGGSGGPFPRYAHLTVSNFNTQGGVIGFDQDNDPPGVRAVDHTTFQGATSTSHFPVFPGSPPPDPYSALTSLQLYFPPYSRDGRAYHRTPPSCPKTGYWTFTADFTYSDGVTQSIESHSACDSAPAAATDRSGRRHPHHRRRTRRRGARA